MPRLELVADCDHCDALCCTHLAFDASLAFAFTKPAGVPCPNLRANRCSIHARLAARGFAGCAAYDCRGAGQRATALFARTNLTDAQKHDVFAALRELHELMWILDTVGDLPTEKLLAIDTAPLRAAMRVAFSACLRPSDAESASRPRPASRGGTGDPCGEVPAGFDKLK